MFTLSCTNRWNRGLPLDPDYIFMEYLLSLVSIKDPIKRLLGKNHQTFSQKPLSLMIWRVLKDTSIVASILLAGYGCLKIIFE